MAAVLLTNWLTVRIPMELAGGLDALRAGDPGVRDASIRIAILGFVVIGVRTLSRIWFFTPARIVEYNLREALFAQALRMQPDQYRRFATGDLISRATSDITFARAYAGFGILQLFNVVGTAVMTVGQMMWMSPLLTLACVLPLVVTFVGMQFGIRRLMALQRKGQVLLGKLSDELLGTIQGVGTVQAFCVEGSFQSRLEQVSGEIRSTNLEMARLRAWMFPAITVAGGVAVYLLLAVGGPQVLAGALTAGQLAAFVALTTTLLFPMMALGWTVSVVQRSEASLERIYAVLDAPVSRPERGRDLPFPTPGRGPSLSLRGLSFGWEPGQRVLSDITAEVPAGATIGIFGRTGSGKSTLLRVLSRLINPEDGMIQVGGVDINRLDLDDWRRRMTLVPQTPFLFSESISENVGFGADAAQIQTAVEAAALGPDLQVLPAGLGTVVGERGIVLSGGQRQRVALARGLLRRSELMLLDDVLAAVDHHTEGELIQMLAERAASHENPVTCIIVSHRMSVLEKVDHIWVMDGGKLVDQGNHAELLGRPGLYREAWQAQQGAEQ